MDGLTDWADYAFLVENIGIRLKKFPTKWADNIDMVAETGRIAKITGKIPPIIILMNKRTFPG